MSISLRIERVAPMRAVIERYLLIPTLVTAPGLGSVSGWADTGQGQVEQLSHACRESMVDWFRPAGEGRPPIPSTITELKPMDKTQVNALRQLCWDAYARSPLANALKHVLPAPLRVGENTDPAGHPYVLETGGKTMPFFFLEKGTMTGKRPLFIALHGGGSAGGRATSPHAWPINTREWRVQALMAVRAYPSPALYFVPRMADDNDGRWYYGYCQDAYDTVVRAAILFHNVDPNRVYLIGVSEGGYTAYRMGAFMADRWAGAGSMAGGEPPRNAPPENMRNLAFRADIGEHDTMFDRVGLNRRFGDALAKLKAEDPHGFTYSIMVQPGRGHGIDYEPCPRWLYGRRRNPYPQRVRWKAIQVDGRHRSQCYWLAMDGVPDAWPIDIDAFLERDSGTIHLAITRDAADGTREGVDGLTLRVYLNDEMMNLMAPIRVVCNGRETFNGIAPRRLQVMLRSLAERGDPAYVFPAEVIVSAGSSEPAQRVK